MKRMTRAAVLAAATAMVLAACGAAPEEPAPGAEQPEQTSGTDAGGEESIDYKACIVSDEGGFDDASFNEAAFNGLTQARDELGIETAQAESQAETDFVPNIDSMVNQDCDMVITVGFLLADATLEAAEANTETSFVLLDDSRDAENIKPVLFNTAEAAFLAGYLAAGYSQTGTVATFGGLPIPPVTIFMDGFADGVAHYNEVKGADVQVLGWDKAAQSGEFVGNFSDIAAGQNLTRSFIDAGADVILPVAGPVGSGAAAAAQEAGDVVFIGVDQDWFETAPEYQDVVLTSVLKQMGPAVFDIIAAAVDGGFDNETYVGTLENGGVDISPFHNFDGEIDDELKAEIDQLRQDIIDGTVVVESDASPQG
ncbi:MAG: BMP family ABC transporter substrate-binding protein [Actinotalea sp.]|nr:BMP family ABC transporter substrate-binding protein [Actinotalea sp.]